MRHTFFSLGRSRTSCTMNRKTTPVTISTIRRRTRADVQKRLQQIIDDCRKSTDCRITECDLGHDSGQSFGYSLNRPNNTPCAASESVFVCDAEGGLELDEDMFESYGQAQSSSEHSDDEVFETFSLADSISNWAVHFGISLVALTALLGILRMKHPELPKDGRTLLRTNTEYNQYIEARQYLNKSLSCNTSDLVTEDEEEDIRPKRKAKHFFGHSDVDSEEDDLRKRARVQPEPSSQPPAPAVPPPPCHVPRSSTVVPTPPTPPMPIEGWLPVQAWPAEEQASYESLMHTRRRDANDSDTGPYTTALAHLIKLMEYMKNQQEQMVAKLNYLTSKLNQTAQEVNMPVPMQFPLSTMAEVDGFEEWLKDPANSQHKQSLISSLATIGGQDSKRVTWNLLAHMFTDDVGKMINWKGVNGKKSFSQMASKTLLSHSVRKNPVARSSTDHDVSKHAIRWFNLAADRGTSRKRSSTPEVRPAEKDM